MPQPILRQVVALGFVSRGKTQESKIIALVTYIYPQKAKPEPIARTTDFELIMGIGKIGIGVLGSEV